MVDVVQMERTLDLWASMWEPHERVWLEGALQRVLDGDGPQAIRLAVLAACRIIATPRLLGAAERASASFDHETLAEVNEIAEPRARLLRHAERLARDRCSITFLLDKAVREPRNQVVGNLLDRVDIRDLYAVMNGALDDDIRVEAARRLARRGPAQRARLLAAHRLESDAFDDQLSVEVSLEELALSVDATRDDLDHDVEIEWSLNA